MMVIHQCNRANGFMVPGFPFFLDKVVPDQIAKGFLTIPASLSSNELIKAFEQDPVNGNSETRHAGHFLLPR